jgi:hypothetical protein
MTTLKESTNQYLTWKVFPFPSSTVDWKSLSILEAATVKIQGAELTIV